MFSTKQNRVRTFLTSALTAYQVELPVPKVSQLGNDVEQQGEQGVGFQVHSKAYTLLHLLLNNLTELTCLGDRKSIK